MSWIKTVSRADATGKLVRLYASLTQKKPTVDEVLKVHSLRPATMAAHLSLYKSVLHNPANRLPLWALEMIGVWVSSLNGCEYCVVHHRRGLRAALASRDSSASEPGAFEPESEELESLLTALEAGTIKGLPLSKRYKQALRYATGVTLAPAGVKREDITQLQEVGFADGEILEINQVCAYFAYANRTVLGLGCSLEGDAQPL